jgi:hypothetical protein
MENENMNLTSPEEEVNTAAEATEEITVCDCDCDCDCTEEMTAVLESSDEATACAECEEEPTALESRKDMLARKCREVKDACRSTADRLAKDLKETCGNPYVKCTSTCRVDIYKHPDDETPIDTFYTEKVKATSLRALAVAGTVAFALMCTAECVVKKFLK